MPLYTPIPEVSVGEDVVENWGDQVARALNAIEPAMVPIGGIVMWPGASLPASGRWLWCDNSQHDSTTYPELSPILGGSGGTFRTPPMVDRMPFGAGGTVGRGTVGGSFDSVVTSHQHTIHHGHGFTGNENADHAHVAGNHTHPINTWTNAQGGHSHANGAGGQFVGSGYTNDAANLAQIGNGFVLFDRTEHTGDHQHSINSNTDGSGGFWTGGVSANHQHYVSENYDSSGFTGGDGKNANMPPYYGVGFIIRAL
jgi:hypothetical protein